MPAASRRPGRSRYEELEPWYCTRRAAMIGVRGALGDRSDGAASFAALSASRRCPTSRRSRGPCASSKAQGLHPVLAAVSVQSISRRGCSTLHDAWDAFPEHPDAQGATPRTAAAGRCPARQRTSRLETGARSTAPDRLAGRPSRRGRRRRDGERVRDPAAPNSWSSRPARSIRRRSCCARRPTASARPRQPLRTQVGRNFMNHNPTADDGHRSARPNRLVYQKTLAVNDFYFGMPATAASRSGNVQLLGKIHGAMLKANVPFVPRLALDGSSRATPSTGT